MAGRGSTLTVLVLAAGQGKRMRSDRIKLLHPVAGRPMVVHVLEAVRSLGPAKLVTVIGHQADDVRAALASACSTFVLQAEQRGTGHAVLQAERHLRGDDAGTLLIVNGDLPTLKPGTLRRLVGLHRKTGADLTLVSAELEDPTGYGRIVRSVEDRVLRIVEDRDANDAERQIPEINCGIYCAEVSTLLPVLRRLKPDNSQGEYYLTDAVHRILEKGGRVEALLHEDPDEVLGVNTRQELAYAGLTLYARKAEILMTSGVTILDPSRTWVDPRARIGRDTVLHPDVIIEGPSIIGSGCIVRAGCRLRDVRVGSGVEVRDHSVIEESVVMRGASVGPFAHLRPGSVLEAGARVGNFVEVKKSRLGRGVKASHLSYLGDATIGAESNIGAGTITCNYDGESKSPTVLGRRVFVGSDTQLVAPVRVGDGAYIGAGTTVTEDVPPRSLALSRAPQKNIEGWVTRRKTKRKKKAQRH